MGYKDPEKKKAAQKRRYEKVKAGGFVHRKRAYHRNYQALTDYKTGKPCMVCGGTFPSVVMEFDHRDPSQKVDRVTRLAQYSVRRMIDEIAKCDLVCANCHRIRTFTRRPLGHLAYFDGLGNKLGNSANDNDRNVDKSAA